MNRCHNLTLYVPLHNSAGRLKSFKHRLFCACLLHGCKITCEVFLRLDVIFYKKHPHFESAPSLQNNKVVKPQQEAAVRPHRLLPTASRPID